MTEFRQNCLFLQPNLKRRPMIFKFTLLSDEVDDFRLAISIDSDATFLDLHQAILEAINFEKNTLTSFFICSDEWEKEQEITLIEMDTASEYDNLVMEDTVLDEVLDYEKQKLLFVFDFLYDRMLFMELSEIISGKNKKTVEIVSLTGHPPAQNVSEDIEVKDIRIDLDQDFYGDEDFDMDELDDLEGNIEEIDESSFY